MVRDRSTTRSCSRSNAASASSTALPHPDPPLRLPPPRSAWLWLALLGAGLAGCAHARAVSTPNAAAAPFREQGLASFYTDALAGHRTANGERYSVEALTAAHRSLPFGTYVRVTAQQSGRSVVVRINDRGPFVQGRIIDLSREAAHRIGLLEVGVLAVTIEIVPSGPGLM